MPTFWRAFIIYWNWFLSKAFSAFFEMIMPGFPVLHHLPELAQTHVHWINDAPSHLVLYCPLLLPTIFPRIRVFSNKWAVSNTWLKYWGFSIDPSNAYLGLISFRIDWFNLLAFQGTLKSFLQHHSYMIPLKHCWI